MKYVLFGLGVVVDIMICVLYVVGYAVEQEQGWGCDWMQEIIETSQETQLVTIPVKQYVDSIMALQKLADIRSAVYVSFSSEVSAQALVQVVRNICGKG